MWYYHRTFQEVTEDFKTLCAFISNLNRKGINDWSIGRLFAWKYGRWSKKSQDSTIFSKQAELFFNYFDQLCGIAITEDYGVSYYLLSEDNEFVIQAMIEFLQKGGNFYKQSCINVREDDTYQIRVLTKNGLSYLSKADTTYLYEAEDICLPDIKLPKGYSITSQKEFTDDHQAELLRFYAFNPDGCYDETRDWAYKYARTNPLLDKELEILLLNEKGESIATCMGHLDRENLSMEVEVVATKKEYENRGFAKVVISECIKRGIDKGIKEIEISAWEEKTRRLYSSFGKCKVIQKVNYK